MAKDFTEKDIKNICENPEYMNIGCDKHHFLMSKINGRFVLVYAEKVKNKHYKIICADTLLPEKIAMDIFKLNEVK